MQVQIKKRQYMVAESGEVFYTEGFKLKKARNLEEYNAMVERERKLATTYFEITVNGCYHKIQMVNETAVFKVLKELTFEERVKEQTRYFKEKEAMGL